MPNLNIPLSILGIEKRTLLPDGSELLANDMPISIAERKRVTAKFSTTYSGSFEGINLWIKIGMFGGVVSGALTSYIKTPIDFYIQFPVGLTAGKYPMPMFMPSGVNYNLNNNLQCYLEILTTTTFNIVLEFYQIYDELDYQKTSFQDNHNKLLKDWKQSPSELIVDTVQNCYNSASAHLIISARFEKDNVIHAPDTYLYTDNCTSGLSIAWLAAFYNKNSVNNMPYFSNPIWEFKRNTIPVLNLSASVNTNISFKITSPTTVDKVLAWIINTDKTDNLTTMFANYEANFEDIDNSIALINSDKIIKPFVDIVSLGAGVFEIGYIIDSTKLTNMATYRLISIVYYLDGTDSMVNSFISDPLICNSSPCYSGDGFDVRGSLDDYNRQFDGNDLECCIEERMRSKIKLDFSFNKWKNDIYNRLGLVVGNDIRRYLTNVSVNIFNEYVDPSFGLITNIYDYKISTKFGVSSYSPQSNMTLNFSNNWAEFIYEWRNRFEQNTPCVSTLVNGVPTLPVLDSQYWGGKTMKIQWVLSFFYDDYKSPFSEDIVVNQQIRVKDYGEMSVKHIEEDGVRSDFNDTSNFCQGLIPCFAGVLNGGKDATDRKLIVNIFPENASVDNVEEAEVWKGNQLAQMTTPNILTEDEDYSVIYTKNAAKFCVDTSKLLLSSYHISAMAKKFVDEGFRITEKEDPSVFEDRITESNDKRIIDNL